MASCTYRTPSKAQLDASGDTLYGDRMAQSQAFFDWAWGAYDFDEGDWNEGFGHEDRWNRTKALARTMAGLYCLVYSPGAGNWDPAGNILQWGWRYASRHIDELDARCGDGSAIASTRYGIIIDNYTNLYLGFFYGQGVVLRAGTIVHEARHADWKGHDDGNNDSSWEHNGAWRWQVVWLWWYCVSDEGTPALRLQAKQRANAILATYFTSDPGFRIQ